MAKERLPIPGLGEEISVTPSEFIIQSHRDSRAVTVSSAARDAGNTGETTTLRPGLVLGLITASGLYKEYDPYASDGSETAKGILEEQVKVIDEDANATNALGVLFFHGIVSEAALIGIDDAAKLDLKLIEFLA